MVKVSVLPRVRGYGVRVLFPTCLCLHATLVLLLLLSAVTARAADLVDRILTNGKIVTVDQSFTIVDALAIRGERIAAVGSNAEILAHKSASTEVVDLQGRTVIPGLIDNHVHFIRTVQRWHQQARLDGLARREQAIDAIAKKAGSLAPGAWLMVQGGWSKDQFVQYKGGFTLEELDRASPNNPLYVQLSYRGVYANSLALQAAGITPERGAWQGGRQSISRFYRLLPRPAPAQIEQNLFDFVHALNKAGLTTVYDVGRPSEGDIGLLERASSTRTIPLRIFHTLKYRANTPAEADEAVALIQEAKPFAANDRLGHIGLGEHIYGPMHDNAGTSESYPGAMMAQYMKIATAAARGGWQIHEHTMADQTISDLLDQFEVLNKRVPIAGLRWTLAHVLTISPESIRRAKALGLTAAVHGQALHQAWPIVPRRNALRPPIPPLRELQESGIVWGLGTDAGVVSHYQPFVTLAWAATGRGLDGTRIMERPVSRRQALIAHTRANAYLLFKERDLGSLEPGKRADLLVLDRDYLTVPEDEIKDIRPLITMVGG